MVRTRTPGRDLPSILDACIITVGAGLAGSVVPLLIADALYGFMNLAGTWRVRGSLGYRAEA